MRTSATVATLALILAACGAGTTGSDTPTTSPPPTESAPATEDTVQAPTTSPPDASPHPKSLTPNNGNLNLLGLVDEKGEVPDDVLVGCGGGGLFSLSDVINLQELDNGGFSRLEEAIAPFLESEEGKSWPQEGWLVIHEDGERAVIVNIESSTSEVSVAFMEIERSDDEWRWAGASIGGDCELEVSLPPTLNRVEWRLDQDAEPLTAESTTISLLANERECASGQSMGDRLLGPEVVAHGNFVWIALAAEPQPGDQNCPSNPDQPVVIELDGPIGTRVPKDALTLGITISELIESALE